MSHSIISVFDTSIAMYNLGNQIIMDAVNLELDELFKSSFIVRLPIDDITRNARRYNERSCLTFVGGTNVLNGDIRRYRQWNLTLHNIFRLRRVILMGCGWFQYEQQPVSIYTSWALHKVLSSTLLHSVRDEYTRRKLESIGIMSINTGCPTIWRLTPELTGLIQQKKSPNAVITITDYNQNRIRDKKMIEMVLDAYSKVVVFPQGIGDIAYVKSLGYQDKVHFLNPRLEEFNRVLKDGYDYIGTRLHAGIRALQMQCRSFIVGIDNRALEMKRDFNLPVLPQEEIDMISEWIERDYILDLNIPTDQINQWRSQFKSYK